MEQWLYPFRPSINPASIVHFPHPEWWPPTDEGHARLPLLFSVSGKLQQHQTIAHSPAKWMDSNKTVGEQAAPWHQILKHLCSVYLNLQSTSLEAGPKSQYDDGALCGMQ